MIQDPSTHQGTDSAIPRPICDLQMNRLGDYRVIDDDGDDDPILINQHGYPLDTWRKGCPYGERMSREDYQRDKRLLQIELLKLQNWVKPRVSG
jgi:polyphosphate kinase